MAVQTNQDSVNLFKKVYGKLENAVPQFMKLEKDIPFSTTQKVGDSFVIAVVLTNETGWTIAGSGQIAFDINDAISGVVKQARIIPSQTLLRSVIPFAFVSRSQGDAQAFEDGTKYIVRNNMSSHSKLLEIIRWYGQSPDLLGYVTFAPAGTVYRGQTYSGSGNVILPLPDGTTITFTAGINAASKAILLAPGQWASGIWVGTEGAKLYQVDSTGTPVAQGKLVGVDADLGILYVDFVPVAASATAGAGSVRVCFQGQELGNDAVGVHRILTNTGTLFEISAASYSLWRSSVLSLGNKKFNMKALQLGVALGVNRGGLDKPLKIYVNPRTFSQMIRDEAALRKYDASYSKDAKNGFEQIEYYAANGVNSIEPHPMVKEGHVFGLELGSWIRSGSAQISFKIPGMPNLELLQLLEKQAGYIFQTWADQFILCQKPAIQILWKDVNDEGVDY